MRASRASEDHARPGLRAWGASCVLLALSGVATEAASRFIQARFPLRPLADDLLLSWLPHLSGARELTSVMITAGVLSFGVYALTRDRDRVPEYLTMVAVMYALRAAMIVLTPLANANDGAPAAFPVFQYGMFPSGHIALMSLLVAFSRTNRQLRAVEIALAFGVAAGMLVARSHYTIDLIGGALLAYFIAREWECGRVLRPMRRLVLGR